jgi:hypothetical protein
MTKEMQANAINDAVAEIDAVTSAYKILVDSGEASKLSVDKLLTQVSQDLERIKSLLTTA